MEPSRGLSHSFTFSIPKDAVETEDLSCEDANGDEELWHHPNSSSEVFGGHFPKEHGNHIGSQT